MRCPTCKQALDVEPGRFRPFCSERCKLIDLGRWLDGGYAIPGEPASDEDLEADLQADGPSSLERRGPARRFDRDRPDDGAASVRVVRGKAPR